MKMRLLLMMLVSLLVLGQWAVVGAQGLEAQQLADRGLPAGAARDVLPGGAVLHLQVHDLLSVVEGVEEILVAGVPEKAMPPEIQELLQTEHPLLTLLGMQTVQQPLTAELLGQMTGIDTRRTISLTLYMGDPRRTFILTVPAQYREPLVPLLNAALEPSEVQEVTIGETTAVRMVSETLPFLPELYLVSSSDTVFICGDRSLVSALRNTPAGQRLGKDPFMSRALPATEEKQLRLVLNPATIKPFAMQLQGLGMMAKSMIPQGRAQLMQQLPREAREQIEMQLRMNLGVRDLDQFVDYVECVLTATMDMVLEGVSARMMAFEGFEMTASLHGGLVEFGTTIHSSRFQAETSTQVVPIDQVKKTLAWLGPQYQSFTVTGRQAQPKQAPIISAWAKRVQQQCQMRGLPWPGLARYIAMLDALKPVPVVESRTPWVLTTRAPLQPAPSLAEAASLEAYLVSLELLVYRPVKITPDQGRDFLESCFREEVSALNENRRLGLEFANTIQPQKPFFLRENRFDATSMDGGITRYTRESSWATRGGIFGYDQHELVNRKVVYARRVGDYLVYHRGVMPSSWLGGLKARQSGAIAPGVAGLLDRVPEGANYVSVQRWLQDLPGCIDWIGQLESRLHADVMKYLEQAQAAVDSSGNLDDAIYKIQGMKVPIIIGSVNIDPTTKKVYAILPTGDAAFVLPRPKVVPLVQKLLADYEAKADSLGGSLVYTKVGGGACQFSMMQDTAALTMLTKTVGNALFENYLGSEEGQARLRQSLNARRDWDRSVFDEVVVRNPQWAFIPQPKPKKPAKVSATIPTRVPGTDDRLIDLSAYYNAALTETWHGGGMEDNTLRDLPRGVHTFADVSFDVRGIIQLSGQQAENELSVQFPKEVADIKVRQKAQKVHFLHGCGWQSGPGTPVGVYIVYYSDGQSREVPILYGVDVRDWWLNEQDDTAASEVQLVWKGQNHAAPDGPPLGVSMTTWTNPLPNVQIERIDYTTTMENSAPFLIAITVE